MRLRCLRAYFTPALKRRGGSSCRATVVDTFSAPAAGPEAARGSRGGFAGNFETRESLVPERRVAVPGREETLRGGHE